MDHWHHGLKMTPYTLLKTLSLYLDAHAYPLCHLIDCPIPAQYPPLHVSISTIFANNDTLLNPPLAINNRPPNPPIHPLKPNLLRLRVRRRDIPNHQRPALALIPPLLDIQPKRLPHPCNSRNPVMVARNLPPQTSDESREILFPRLQHVV
jgi:hypothetical protein